MNFAENYQSVQLIAEGFRLMFDYNFTESIPKFDEALDIYPEFAIALQGRALCKMFIMFNFSDKHHYELFREIESDLSEALKLIRQA